MERNCYTVMDSIIGFAKYFIYFWFARVCLKLSRKNVVTAFDNVILRSFYTFFLSFPLGSLLFSQMDVS